MISWSALLVLLPLVSAFPTEHRRAVSPLCDQFFTLESGSYSLLTNLWGEDGATGSQCSKLISVHDSTVVWETKYKWVGGNSIKSYTNIQLNIGTDQQLSAISSMPSTWEWSQQGTGKVVSDVAYDTFTSATAGGSNLNEVMIWLFNCDAGPISYQYGADGHAVPIAGDIQIGSHTWNLYKGSNGFNTVYSFLPKSGHIPSFSGDLYKFFAYLIDHSYINAWEYLTTAQAGTEVTSGEALFKTSAYSLSIN